MASPGTEEAFSRRSGPSPSRPGTGPSFSPAGLLNPVTTACAATSENRSPRPRANRSSARSVWSIPATPRSSVPNMRATSPKPRARSSAWLPQRLRPRNPRRRRALYHLRRRCPRPAPPRGRARTAARRALDRDQEVRPRPRHYGLADAVGTPHRRLRRGPDRLLSRERLDVRKTGPGVSRPIA